MYTKLTRENISHRTLAIYITLEAIKHIYESKNSTLKIKLIHWQAIDIIFTTSFDLFKTISRCKMNDALSYVSDR